MGCREARRSGIVALVLDSPMHHLTLFIQKSAYSSDAIGTVTPLNNAALCSVTKPWQRNEVPRGFTVDTYGTLIESVSQREYLPIPTGMGLWLHIKRPVLESIGHNERCATAGRRHVDGLQNRRGQ